MVEFLKYEFNNKLLDGVTWTQPYIYIYIYSGGARILV